MATPSATVASVPSPLSDNVHDDDEPKLCIPPENMSWVQDYASQCNNGATPISPSVAQLQRLHEILTRALGSDAVQVVKLCNFLPGVINRTLDCNIAAGAVSPETNFQGYMLEVLCALTELTVAIFSSRS